MLTLEQWEAGLPINYNGKTWYPLPSPMTWTSNPNMYLPRGGIRPGPSLMPPPRPVETVPPPRRGGESEAVREYPSVTYRRSWLEALKHTFKYGTGGAVSWLLFAVASLIGGVAGAWLLRRNRVAGFFIGAVIALTGLHVGYAFNVFNKAGQNDGLPRN